MTKYRELTSVEAILNKCNEALARYAAKGKPEPKTFSVTDGEGLRLDVTTKKKGLRSYVWRYQYRRPNSATKSGLNNLTFGELFLKPYGGVTIALARESAQEAAALLAQGIDPADVRNGARAVADAAAKIEAEAAQRAKEGKAPLGSFQAAAENWLEFKSGNVGSGTLADYKHALTKHVYPAIGHMVLSEIRSKHVATIKDALTRAGTLCSLDVALNHSYQVFERERELGNVEFNPVQRLSSELKRQKYNKRSHQPRVTEPTKLAGIIKAVRDNTSAYTARDMALVGMYTMQRSHSIAQMRWDAVDLDAGVWTIEAKYLKLHRSLKESGKTPAHIVPLSKQVVSLLRARKMKYQRNGSPWVFANKRDESQPGSAGAAGALLRKLGFKGIQSMHGFRGTGRTMGQTRVKLDGLMLETQLAHKQKGQLDSGLGQAYLNMDEFLREEEQLAQRADVMQQWADYLDSLDVPAPDLKLAA